MSDTPVSMTKVRGKIRSPFRYPGGKSWLAPVVEEWLRCRPDRVTTFVEPFAGGASVSLAVAAAGLADRLLLVERDPDVAAVWHAVFGQDAEALAKAIVEFELTEANVNALLASDPEGTLERALRTIVWNRVSHGGRMTNRAGILRSGERGKGLSSRWYPVTLAARIRDAARYADRVRFVEGDAFEEVAAFADDQGSVLFLDPPYSKGARRAGERLYSCCDIDHEKLFDLASAHAGAVLLTYDDDPTVRQLATHAGLDVQPVLMRTTHHASRAELLISGDISWVAPATSAVSK